MKKFLIIFSILFYYSYPSEFKYFLNVECTDKKLAENIKIGSFRFISGKDLINDIKIMDEKNIECEIIGVNFSKGEIEVFFKLTDSLNYNVFLGYSEGKVNKKFKKGVVLIDDYIPPNSIKSGEWIWNREKVFSGLYSHINKDCFSFHRVNFSKQYQINPDDRIIVYVYIEKNSPVEEFIIEIVSRYRKHYYYSFGEDKIKIKGINKEKIGQIPEKGKWVKLEIPLVKIKEKNIEGIGFYNDKGKLYWDFICLNEDPVKMKIGKIMNLKDKNIPYFDYEIEGPFRIKDKKFAIVNLDGSFIPFEKYIWEVNKKNYIGEKISLEIEGDKKEIEVKLRNEKNREFCHKIDLPEEKEISVFFNILPFENFIYENEKVYIPLRVENMSEIPLKFNIFYSNEKKEIFLIPGKENGKTINLDFDQYDNNIELKLCFYNIEISRKMIKIIDLDEKDYVIDGVFFKKDDYYIVFKVPEYSNDGNKTFFKRVILFGDFPFEIVEFFNSNGFEVETYIPKSQKYINYLFNELNFVQKNIDNIKNDDLVIFFPFLNSLLRRHRINEWAKVYDSIFYLLSKKTLNLIVISPFPSYPDLEIFRKYKDKLKEISRKRNLKFINLYDVYSKIEESEKFFKINDYIYKNLPNREGCKIIFNEILKIIRDEKCFDN